MPDPESPESTESICDLMRFGLAPFHVRFTDIFDAVEILRGILSSGAWDRPEFRQRAKVT